MSKYIKKKALKNAIECCTWYHINPKRELTTGAYGEEDALIKYSDIKKIIKGLPTRKFEDEPQTDCNGCKFVGWCDTEFPCVNCVRKTKDYYTAEQTEREGE